MAPQDTEPVTLELPTRKHEAFCFTEAIYVMYRRCCHVQKYVLCWHVWGT